jgi:hypothetical protein
VVNFLGFSSAIVRNAPLAGGLIHGLVQHSCLSEEEPTAIIIIADFSFLFGGFN